MKKIIAIFIFLPLFSFSQNSSAFWEVGAYVGGLNYLGEITEEGDLGTWINEMRPEFGLVLKRNFNYRTSLGVEAGWGMIYAADNNHGSTERNFVVNTQLVQANLIFQINFKKFGKYFKRNANTPFVKTGIGLLAYTPYLNTNGTYPDSLELYAGSYATYNFQLAFGWKWRVSEHSIIAIDLHWNGTGSSYLEGFNLKDKANPNDAIYGLRFTYSYGIF